MFKSKGSHVFASLAAALAITGCAPGEQLEGAAGTEEGPTASSEQSVSVITGYDLYLRAGTYTRGGYILPQWSGPSTKGNIDWIGLYKVGAPDNAYLNLQYVGKGLKGTGTQIRVPDSLSTADRYEVRYLRSNTFEVAARSSAFAIKATPTLACASASIANAPWELPAAHYVSLGKTSGKVSFYYHHGTAGETRDRTQVWSDNELLFDTGCTNGTNTVTLNYTNANSRLLVTTQPGCDGSTGDYWSTHDWSLSCPQ
ncbi:MAG TPA: hypothetical protein VEU33_10935 [Archangium sp.]|nr:hypothetical protein [Archangium sp.]